MGSGKSTVCTVYLFKISSSKILIITRYLNMNVPKHTGISRNSSLRHGSDFISLNLVFFLDIIPFSSKNSLSPCQEAPMGEGSLWAAAHCGPPGSDGQVQVLLASCHIAAATEAAGEVRGGDVREARREACQDSSSSLPNVCNSPASRSPSSTGPVLHTHKRVQCVWANTQSVFSRQHYEISQH